jgi:hypothetical protein
LNQARFKRQFSFDSREAVFIAKEPGKLRRPLQPVKAVLTVNDKESLRSGHAGACQPFQQFRRGQILTAFSESEGPDEAGHPRRFGQFRVQGVQKQQ